MTTESATVVDNHGKLITESTGEASLGLTAAQSQHKQKMEEVYRQRVTQILSPIVGDSNVRSQVNMSLDFTQTETTTEDFDTKEKGPKTRSEASSEDRNSAKDAGGVPGSLSNTAPASPTTTTNTAANSNANANSADRSTITARSTRNYEIDRSVRHVKGATGTVERLSVGVVINERAPVSTKNDKGEVIEGKALMFLAFLMLVIRPTVMRMLGLLKTPEEMQAAQEALAAPLLLSDGELSPEDMNSIQLGEGETLEEIKAKLKPKKSSISMEMLDTANTYDDKVALVRMIVAEDSARVASVLKNMIKAS